MPCLLWNKLNKLQLGRYAEYYAKMEFASYGYEVYTSEVDDHGVDFISKLPKDHNFLEIQVKSIRNLGYVLIQKSKMDVLSDNKIVCLLIFKENTLPEVYLIPASEWRHPNDLLVDRDYDKDGQISKPEWGINISKKNMPLLEQYKIELFMQK